MFRLCQKSFLNLETCSGGQQGPDISLENQILIGILPAPDTLPLHSCLGLYWSIFYSPCCGILSTSDVYNSTSTSLPANFLSSMQCFLYISLSHSLLCLSPMGTELTCFQLHGIVLAGRHQQKASLVACLLCRLTSLNVSLFLKVKKTIYIVCLRWRNKNTVISTSVKLSRTCQGRASCEYRYLPRSSLHNS